MIRYIDDFEEHAAGYMRRGEPDPEVAAVVVPPQYDDWWFGNFYPHNVRFVLRQMRAAAPKP